MTTRTALTDNKGSKKGSTLILTVNTVAARTPSERNRNTSEFEIR